MPKKPRYEDLSEKVFGSLTAREHAGRDKHGNTLWFCRCTCGGTKIVAAHNLKAGRTTTCGCKVNQKLKRKLNKPLSEPIETPKEPYEIIKEEPKKEPERKRIIAQI